MTTADVKVLRPRLPPGRADRKALAYTSEIQRLRALGYTLEAIRLALADVGVHVGLTTVKREAARGAAPPHPPTWLSTPTRAEDHPSPPPAAASGLPVAVNRRSGRQIAEEFVQSHVSNPLVRAQLESAGSDDEAR